MSKYDIPYDIGSTPAAEFYKKSEGGEAWLIIHDQRAPFAADAAKAVGGIYDTKDKVIKFRDNNQAGFEEACEIVTNIPYFELPRNYARYVTDEMRAMRERNDSTRPVGLETMLRSPFDNNPESRQQDLRIMAATKTTYDKGMEFVNRVKVAPVEQVNAIKKAISDGKIDDDTLSRHDTTLDELQLSMDEGTLDRPNAQRILNLVQPIERKKQEMLREHIEDGRLVDRDLSRYNVDAKSLNRLTVQEGYDLADLAKKRATTLERDLVTTLQELGYKDRSIDLDIMKLTSAKAKDFIDAKEPMLTESQRATFNAVKRGEKATITPTESALDKEINAAAPGVPVVPFTKTIGALRIIAVAKDGIAGYADERENEVVRLTTEQTSKKLRETPVKVGEFVVAETMSRGGVIAHASAQKTADAAIVERIAIRNAEKTGLANATALSPDDIPARGEGTVVHVDKRTEISAVVLDEQQAIAVIPNAYFNEAPALFQHASFAKPGEAGEKPKKERQAAVARAR